MTGDYIPSDAGEYDYDSDSVEMNGKSNPAGVGNADVDPYSGKRLNRMISFGTELVMYARNILFKGSQRRGDRNRRISRDSGYTWDN